MQTDLPLPDLRRGKVRDVYRCRTTDGRDAVLLVATDRLSAFDVVMPTPLPGKGRLLTQISLAWFEWVSRVFGDRMPHHVISADPAVIEGLTPDQVQLLQGRVVLGQPTRVIPIECVARGYLAGSAWTSYQQTGRVCGIELPPGLQQAQQLPEPIFTPATKAESGHDENISFDEACDRVGGEVMTRMRDQTLTLFHAAHEHAAKANLILADTKFEFGVPLDGDARPILIDEVLTPDSSRYWPQSEHKLGTSPPSFDKQYVRDYLQSLVDAGQWDKQPPGPGLPEAVMQQTLLKYHEARDALAAIA